jgi:Activator of Hsp90 ATPase homolog 1-like protein
MNKGKNFTTSIEADKSATEVFNAINNVRGWWQGEIKGNTEKLNDEFTYQMGDFHLSKQKIVELIPGKKVVWLVTESKINFVADKNEWLNTKIIFEITPLKNKTKLTFTHEGLVPAIECYGGCSGAWAQLIEKSLFSLVTTGKGVDVF